MTWTLYQGDCREVLKQFPDNHFDACVTDPPYGLEFMGKDWDNLGDAGRNRQKAIEKSSFGSIMGAKTKSPRIVRVRRRKCVACGGYSGGPFENCKCSSPTWEQDTYPQAMQDWHCQWAKEVLRVLKPGAHLLSFGGSRTYHRMACAIEDAGFEIRDQIQWIYGSGFPKSMDISKAIDKAAGAEREDAITGGHMGISQYGGDARNANADAHYSKIPHIVGKGVLSKGSPATPEAEQWDGWGTALKPAHEPIALAQKPKEGTFAVNVLKYGVGGINIDGCRIETNEQAAKCEHKGKVYDGVSDGYKRPNKSSYTHKTDWHMDSNGRFPANIILDGSEEVLTEFAKAGERPSEWSNRKTARNSDLKGVTEFGTGKRGKHHSDTGTAARFFKICKGDELCESVSIAEKSLNLQETVGDSVLRLVAIEGHQGDRQLRDLVIPFMTEMRKQLNGNIETDTPKMVSLGEKCLRELLLIIMGRLQASHVNHVDIKKLINTMTTIQNLLNIDGFVEAVMSDTILLNMVLGGLGCLPRFNYCAKASQEERKGSKHPTVKPLELMKYLCRLITPQGGLILDPFAGSGTTIQAAVEEGFRVVGIEKDSKYCEDIRNRMANRQTTIFEQGVNT